MLEKNLLVSIQKVYSYLFLVQGLNFIPHYVLEFDTLDLEALFLKVGSLWESYRGEHKCVKGEEEQGDARWK